MKCSACGKEIPNEELENKMLFFDEKTGTALCFSCGTKMVAKMAVQNQQPGTAYPEGNVLAEEQAAAAKLQMQKEGARQLFEIVSKESPAKIKEHLDKYIVGQDSAKRVLSVAVYNHYKRLAFFEAQKCKELETGKKTDGLSQLAKSNILMLGPTGTGKTAILKAIARRLGVPFTVVDTSTLTRAGYVGSDPETCVRQLYEEAGKNREKTERGIIFLDEFDKIARKSGTNRSTSADPGQEGVQQALLKIIEGTKVHFTQGMRKHPDAPTTEIDTTNILFVCGGAFEGIEKIISKRIDENNGFGYCHEDKLGLDAISDEADKFNRLIDEATPEDMREYGIIPEMLGRLPIMCKLHQLKEDDLVRILTEPKDAIIKQFAVLFSMDNCKLKIDREALKKIAEKAIKTGTGARSLRTIIEGILLDTMFDLPQIAEQAKEGQMALVKITKESVETKKLETEYIDMPQAA